MSKIDNQDVAIRVHNIKKDFYLPHEKSSKSLKSIIVNTFKKKDKGADIQHVLRGLSFDIKKGEFFGIVGRNGSGKSTLLKILAQIYQPTGGKVEHFGKLVPFIELGVGFNPELSGRENVYLNGALLGFTREEIAAKYDKIVEFAELEDFMDQKLKNYSSGMQVRLAFSVAIQADADILVLDEVLAVGDEAFQKKCQDYFYKLKKDGKTVILVTHSMESVRSFCDKAVLIDKGNIIMSGNPDKVAGKYSEMFQEEYAEMIQKERAANHKAMQNSDIYLENVKVVQSNKDVRVVKFHEDFSLNLEINSNSEYEDVTIGLHIVHQSGQTVAAITTKTFQEELQIHKGLNVYNFNIQNIFSEGNYSLNIAVKQKTTSRFLIQVSDSFPFSVVGIDSSKYNPSSLVYPEVKLSVK